jgi:hypothetical protein
MEIAVSLPADVFDIIAEMVSIEVWARSVFLFPRTLENPEWQITFLLVCVMHEDASVHFFDFVCRRILGRSVLVPCSKTDSL